MSFTLQQTIDLPDINSIGYVYEHTKTKAKVFYIANDDTNKTFSIAFATPPYSDNGIAHILEHSVLCGSRKYPTKEPFVELLKGSLNTFLNAMTFADKTIYPVASQNDKDFKHLMDVYLDAVFFPKLLNEPKILQQEGWHYHLEQAEDDLAYTGVVYNEMKGAFSDPNQVIQRAIQNALFPDTIYAHESGGDPLAIPELTQEEFVHFHQTYYHPSNSYTVLYGKMNIQDQLSHLDEYFDLFDYCQIDNKLTQQAPFESMRTLQLSYSITEEESQENKTFMSLDFVIGQSSDIALNTQFMILTDILLGSEASPLRQNLMASGITSDVIGDYSTFTLQSVFSILIKNSEPKHLETFKNIVFNTLTQLVKDGIPSKLITAAINKIKFQLKEAEQAGTPKGVLYAILTTDSVLYQGTAFGNLQFEKHLHHIEQHPELFTSLIQDYLLKNQHVLLTTATPEQHLNEHKFATVQQHLKHYQMSLSKEQTEQIIQQTQALIAYQSQPDTPETLASIPLLSLDDLDKQAKPITLNVEQKDTVTYLHHPTFTSGIDYVNFEFDLAHLTIEELQYASLIARLLGLLSTEQYSFEDLATEIDSHTGGFTFKVNVLNKSTKEQQFTPLFVVKGKAFTDKVDTLFHLLYDILHTTQFEQSAKLKEHLHKIKTQLEHDYLFQGHVVAFSRLKTYFSKAAKLDDTINGITFYQFICELAANFDNHAPELIQKLCKLFTKLFTRSHLCVGFIGTEADYHLHQPALHHFVNQFEHIHLPKQSWDLPLVIQNEGFALASDVQYVAQGFNITLDNLHYNSQLLVLKNILSLNYLWNKVRVQGGAYGAFMQLNRDGDMMFISYRDPHITETLQVYQEATQFVETLQLSQRELTQAIIGTFSDLDAPCSPKTYGEIAFLRYRLGITFDTIQDDRTRILNTTVEDLKQLAPLIKHALKHQACCIVGNKKMLEQASQWVHHIKNLIQ